MTEWLKTLRNISCLHGNHCAICRGKLQKAPQRHLKTCVWIVAIWILAPETSNVKMKEDRNGYNWTMMAIEAVSPVHLSCWRCDEPLFPCVFIHFNDNAKKQWTSTPGKAFLLARWKKGLCQLWRRTSDGLSFLTCLLCLSWDSIPPIVTLL